MTTLKIFGLVFVIVLSLYFAAWLFDKIENWIVKLWKG